MYAAVRYVIGMKGNQRHCDISGINATLLPCLPQLAPARLGSHLAHQVVLFAHLQGQD